MKIKYQQLLPNIIFPVLIGITSSMMALENKHEYLEHLNQPILSPPYWVFGPIWTVLYLMVGLSMYIFSTTKADWEAKKAGVWFYFIQLLFNFFWSFFFFGLKNPIYGLIDISLLLIFAFANYFAFKRINQLSATLLIPYIAWVMYATYLNISFIILNPSFV